MTIGFAITGSFCTFKAVFPQMNLLVEHGYRVLPIMSENAYATDTRFGPRGGLGGAGGGSLRGKGDSHDCAGRADWAEESCWIC